MAAPDGSRENGGVFEHIVNRSADFITLIDREFRYVIANDAYCREMNKDRAEIVGRTVAEVWGEERFRSPIKGFLERCFRGEEVNNIDSFTFGPFRKYMHITYFPYGDNGTVTHALVFSHDITRIGEIESKLTNYEYRDPVTGLFNRRSLGVILEKEIERVRLAGDGSQGCVIMLGLSGMEEITQLHGYEIADLLLENTGLRFRSCLRASDYVFRFDGHELAAIVTSVSERDSLASLAAAIHAEVSTPYVHNDATIAMRCSIGIALYPGDGETTEAVTRNALAAMTEARSRREPYMIFDHQLHEESRRRLRVEGELSAAFLQKELFLEFQPIVTTRGMIAGAEALIRWRHPKRGVVPPGDFIPIAIKTGLIDKIGRWVLFNACQHAARWKAAVPPFVTINLSASEFRGAHLIDNLVHALERAGGLAPSRVRVEITEGEAMVEPSASIRRMKELAAMGVDVYVDDFGTGHSSLGWLRDLPAAALKIDKSFVDNLERDDAERRFLRGLIDIIRIRQKKVIVEGIESPGQAWIANSLDCDWMQGFLFSRPVPAETFEALVASAEPLFSRPPANSGPASRS